VLKKILFGLFINTAPAPSLSLSKFSKTVLGKLFLLFLLHKDFFAEQRHLPLSAPAEKSCGITDYTHVTKPWARYRIHSIP
jgi:hypothetical protein